MQYTKVAANAFEKLVLNAGIVVDEFTPATGEYGNIIGATTGGLTFASNPSDTDFGEDVDNVPTNTWQLKRRTSYDPVISGTLLTVTAAVAAQLTGAADVGSTDTTKVTPRNQFTENDFSDIWMIADYSDKNTGATTAGFVAIHIMHALNTTGFQLKTTKNGKGQFAFEYHGHYDLTDMETVPFEIYVKAGTGVTTLSALSITGVTLSPGFAAGTTVYTASTTDSTNVITATATDSNATVVIKNGATTVTNGNAATWTAGTNTVTVTVTNGGSTTYTITVTKS